MPLLAIVALLLSCGPKAMPPKAALDTPQHHVANGDTLLAAGKTDSAAREYGRARELDPKHAPAHIGLGLCYGLQGDFESGLSSMKAAKRYARNNDEKLRAAVGSIRLHTMGKDRIAGNWLDLAEDAYKRARSIAADRPAPHFHMGMAYKAAMDFDRAAKQFVNVIDLNKGLVGEADREYAFLQKIERASLGSAAGKRIALVEKVSRADTAALLVEELRIETLFRARREKPVDTSFQSPDDGFVTSVTIKISPATDVSAHPLKADIDAVVSLGIKGLQPFPDHTFRPEQMLTRAEFAMVMEDILVKVSGEAQLATRFIGSASPFPDLRNDLSFFNAVMTCTTRGIMEAKNINTGAFDPMGPVPGADAVLAVRALKSQL